MKAAANAKAGAKPLAKINPVPSPAPEPPAFDPVESVTNYKFLETCILEYANTGGKGLPDLVSKTIQKLMQLTDTEQSLIKNSAPDPGGASESVAGWVLRLNGLALGMGLAKAVVVTKTKHDHQAWHKAVRQIEKHFGSQVTRIMVRQSEAKKKEPEQAEVLNDASHRANRLHDELERLTRDTPRHPASESIDPHEETNEPPPKEKGGLLRGLFKKSGP
jgi:hypothetical protein